MARELEERVTVCTLMDLTTRWATYLCLCVSLQKRDRRSRIGRKTSHVPMLLDNPSAGETNAVTVNITEKEPAENSFPTPRLSLRPARR